MLTLVTLCLVVGIIDGDTLDVLCGQPEQHEVVRIRLANIDAPERGQPFYHQSKDHLSRTCSGLNAMVRPEPQAPTYGRQIARVECEGIDASVEQARAGMAWAELEYSPRLEVINVEKSARKTRSGLWRDAKPIAPWQWREERRDRLEGSY
jgi:endonuclease YncB( thermonuclease family)